jgi:hypothetical protein
MALLNQNNLLAFFSSLKVNLKIIHRILSNPTIPEDDLPRMTKSRKMTYRVWPNPGLEQAGITKEDLIKPAS